MKYLKLNNWLIYLIGAPIIVIATFIYILLVSDLEIGAVFRSIQLYVYIIIGYIIVIASLHLFTKYIANNK